MSIYPTPGTAPTTVIFPSDPLVKERTYCVLGAPRGGTSMVAGLVRRLGVFMGNQFNDAVEDVEFLQHKGIRDIFTVTERQEEKTLYLAQASALVAARNAAHKTWGWKDPTAIYYLPELFGFLRNPHFIFITRDAGAVAQAEMIIEPGWPPDHILAHIHAANRQSIAIAEFIAAAKQPTLLISYERTLRHPENAAQALLDFAGGRDALFVDWAKNHILPRRGT